MNKPDSYEDVMKALEEVNDLMEFDDNPSEYNDSKDFKFEYAFESVTERHTAYKRRVSHA